jgi:hypothetical protein
MRLAGETIGALNIGSAEPREWSARGITAQQNSVSIDQAHQRMRWWARSNNTYPSPARPCGWCALTLR